MNIKERKIALRKDVETLRSGLSESQRREKEQLINAGILAQCEQVFASRAIHTSQQAQPVLSDGALFTYMPYRSEPDVTPVMEWCWERGICVLLPRVIKGTKDMQLHAVTSYNDLETGAWGIREPLTSLPQVNNLSSIRMILVPGLAFDKRNGRLGYGGGFYDRFVRKFNDLKLTPPRVVAGAFDAQIVDEVPMSWHDFRIDCVITESSVRTIDGK
ncbi:5-formyltetrahydrofolate cyclo-ligase [Paenibacillus sp. N1-5-1-14]|uniref:5-formyltetrahydrofolate cyclo-ligase n=1 Tax=Paenibacillus radicibacter TaxID=2972488 RepID=UPI0021597178|nr:5-formyltetrahydrofolate cyclo-ligase [Paenibacillus radicibacter]MCR8643590.1 5-formyltetrahydrofolate cyclo-ligase [Paenibacillus radicibacter]